MSNRANTGRKNVASSLTAAEIATLEAMAISGSYAEAAQRLGVTAKTVDNRLTAIRDKLGAPSTRAAVAMWRGPA